MSEHPKEFRFDEEARHALKEGICQLADAVVITLGPRGRNVGLDKGFGSPSITSDGYSIAKEIEFKDPFLNMGASMAKEVAAKIKEKVSDGTTTGIVLLKAIILGGIKQITAGTNPISLKRGIEKALGLILEKIDAASLEIKNDMETKNIAIVSASGSLEVGEIISDCIKKVGKDGAITIEEGKGTETVVEYTDGMKLDQGFISSYFCTNRDALKVEMNHPRVLITDQKIQSAVAILPLLQQIAASQEELLIIADEIEADALSTLVMNHLRGNLKVAAIKAPGFGNQKKAFLEDLAALSEAIFITEEKGLSLQETTMSDLGKVDFAKITKDECLLVSSKSAKKNISTRIAQIEHELKNASSSYEKEKLEERKAKLTGAIAVIQVGAVTESEMRQKKQSFEDSLNATKAALEEGVVAGGGTALLKAARSISNNLTKEEAIGAQVLVRACEAPFRQLVLNAGFEPSIFLNEILQGNKTTGFNVISEKVEDLILSGVIDPTKVVKASLCHAVSVATMVLLSEVLLADC